MKEDKTLHPVVLSDVAEAEGLADGVFFFVGDDLSTELYQKKAAGKYSVYVVKDRVASAQKPLPDQKDEFVIPIPQLNDLNNYLQNDLPKFPPAVQLFILEKIFRLVHMLRLREEEQADYIHKLQSRYLSILRRHKNEPHVHGLVEKSGLLPKSDAVRQIYADNLGMLIKLDLVKIDTKIMKGFAVIEATDDNSEWGYESNKPLIDDIVDNIIAAPRYAPMFLDPALPQHYPLLYRNRNVISRLINSGKPAVHRAIRNSGAIDEFYLFRRLSLYAQLEKAEENASDEYIVQRYLDANNSNKTGFFVSRRLARYKVAADNAQARLAAQKNKPVANAQSVEKNDEPVKIVLENIDNLTAELAKYPVRNFKFEIYTPELIVMLDLTPGQEGFMSYYDIDKPLPQHSIFLLRDFERILPSRRQANAIPAKDFQTAYRAKKIPESPKIVSAISESPELSMRVTTGALGNGDRIIPGAELTWKAFWELYNDLKDKSKYRDILTSHKIVLEPEGLQRLEKVVDKAEDEQTFVQLFVRVINELKAHDPPHIKSQTSHETEAVSLHADVASSSRSRASASETEIEKDKEKITTGWVNIARSLSHTPPPVRSEEDIRVEQLVDALISADGMVPRGFLPLFDQVSNEILETVAQRKLFHTLLDKSAELAEKERAGKVAERMAALIRLDDTVTLDQLKRMRRFNLFNKDGLINSMLDEKITEMDSSVALIMEKFKERYMQVYVLFKEGKYEKAVEHFAALCRRIDHSRPLLKTQMDGAELVVNVLRDILNELPIDASHQYMANLFYHLTPSTAAQKAYSVAYLAQALHAAEINHNALNGSDKLISELMGFEMAFLAYESEVKRSLKKGQKLNYTSAQKNEIANLQEIYVEKLKKLKQLRDPRIDNIVSKLMQDSKLLSFVGQEGNARKKAMDVFQANERKASLKKNANEELEELLQDKDHEKAEDLLAVKLENDDLMDELMKEENKAIFEKLKKRFPELMKAALPVELDINTGKKLVAK